MKKLSTFIIGIFVVGMLFLALPTEADAQPECCQVSPSFCFDNGGSGPLPTACFGDQLQNNSCDIQTGQCVADLPRNVPALSAIGSVAVALVLGVAAFIVLHRRKKASV